jgi:CRP-like cAMP-binding protein
MNTHQVLEMGLIGNEGMLSSTMVLGADRSSMQGNVQGAGEALRLTVTDLRQLLQESPDLHKTLTLYLSVMISQQLRTTACIHFHHIEARLARWLLMSHDRAHADHFYLTHKYIANMLGVRRSGVTVAAGALQQRQLIQ